MRYAAAAKAEYAARRRCLHTAPCSRYYAKIHAQLQQQQIVNRSRRAEQQEAARRLADASIAYTALAVGNRCAHQRAYQSSWLASAALRVALEQEAVALAKIVDRPEDSEDIRISPRRRGSGGAYPWV